MVEKLNEIISKLTERKEAIELRVYPGDISDIGNEIGFIIGKVYPMMTEEQTSDFVSGIKHGISLTNGTH